MEVCRGSCEPPGHSWIFSKPLRYIKMRLSSHSAAIAIRAHIHGPLPLRVNRLLLISWWDCKPTSLEPLQYIHGSYLCSVHCLELHRSAIGPLMNQQLWKCFPGPEHIFQAEWGKKITLAFITEIKGKSKCCFLAFQNKHILTEHHCSYFALFNRGSP